MYRGDFFWFFSLPHNYRMGEYTTGSVGLRSIHTRTYIPIAMCIIICYNYHTYSLLSSNMANIKKPFGKSKSQKLSISLCLDDVKVIKALAEMEGVSVSELMRRGIELIRLDIFKR